MSDLHPREILSFTDAARSYAIGLVGALALSCGTISTPQDLASRGTAPRVAEPVRRFDHVLIVVLENQDYEAAIRDPYLATLAKTGLVLTNFRALFHPSYPNYLAMVSGKTLRTNGDEQQDFDDRTIADLLQEKGLSWRNYAEGYGGGCDTASSFGPGRYARKHVPFLSFSLVRSRACENVVNANQIREDIDDGRFPTYAFYSPNLDNDGHDPIFSPARGLAKASAWLHSFLDAVRDTKVIAESTLVVVTFDESRGESLQEINPFHPEAQDHGNTVNHIYTVLLGRMLSADSSAAPYNHFNVLRTIELNFQLGTLGSGDGEARPIAEVWRSRRR